MSDQFFKFIMNTVIPVANGSGGIYTDSRTYIHLGKAKTVILSQDECDALTEDIGQTITSYHSEELYSCANVSGSVYHSASYKRATKGQQDAGAGRGVGGRRNRQRWGPEEPLEVGSGGTARGGGRRNRQRWGPYPGGWNRDALPSNSLCPLCAVHTSAADTGAPATHPTQ